MKEGSPSVPSVETLLERLSELRRASRILFRLLTWTDDEAHLAKQGLEALTLLVNARYGAVGILSDQGEPSRFVHHGISDEQAKLIGPPPRGTGLLGTVIRENRPLIVNDITGDARSAGFPEHHPSMRHLLAVPVTHEHAIYGRVYLCDRKDGHGFNRNDESLALCLAQVLGRIIAKNRADVVAATSEYPLTGHQYLAREQERKAIARTLHDEMGQWLTTVRLHIERIGVQVRIDCPDVHHDVAQLIHLCDRLQDTLSNVIQGLRPALLDHLGLAETIREHLEEWVSHNPGIQCDFVTDTLPDDLDETIAITVYRIVQEALTNVARHAGAGHVRIRMEILPASLDRTTSIRLSIEDDGCGLDIGTVKPGMGLIGMEERARSIDGTFALTSNQEGTRIEALLPVRRSGHAA